MNHPKPFCRGSDDIVKASGYHWKLSTPTADPDDPESWDLVCGEASGNYRGNVWIDGRSHVYFTDGTNFFAVLEHSATFQA